MKKRLLDNINMQLFAGENEEGTSDEIQATSKDDNAESESKEAEEVSGESTSEEVEKKYTDEDVNKIIQKKLAEERSKRDKAVKEAEKLAKMNEEEKKNYELEKLRAQLEEYQKKETLSDMARIARNMLTEENINVSDDLLSHLVTSEAETTKKNVEEFSREFKLAVDKVVTEKLRGKTPKSNPGNGNLNENMTYTEMLKALNK